MSGGLRPPDPLPGLRPWTPLGDFCPPDPLHRTSPTFCTRFTLLIKTDKWRCAPQIRPARHYIFVVSQKTVSSCNTVLAAMSKLHYNGFQIFDILSECRQYRHSNGHFSCHFSSSLTLFFSSLISSSVFFIFICFFL